MSVLSTPVLSTFRARSTRGALAAVLAGAMGLAVFATPAAAQDEQDALPAAQVHYGDLNLATATGAMQLQDRVRRAADAVCGSPDIRDLAAVRNARNCRTIAMRGAEPQVQVALANARNGVAYAANTVVPRRKR